MPSQGRRGGGSGRGVYHLTLHNNGGPLPPIPPAGGQVTQQPPRQQNQSSSSTSPVPGLSTTTTSPELPSPSVGINTLDMASGGGIAGGGQLVSGEHPTIIQRARPYLTEEQIEDLKPDDPGWEARDVSMRLNSCHWILTVGGVLQL